MVAGYQIALWQQGKSYFRRIIQILVVLTKLQKITVNFVDVVSQSNGCDCGVYSLAFATSLCYSCNPSTVNYISHKLREHLYHCLEKRTMLPFPQCERQRMARIQNKDSFSIYCVCRQPEFGKMIECEACREWFHKGCVPTPKSAWEGIAKWFCSNCSLSSYARCLDATCMKGG